MLQPYEFAEDFTVYGYDGDYRGLARPGALLRYAQEVAGQQCTHYGITGEVYARTHTAYVLAKTAMRFVRVPRVGERLTLITQPEALKRAVNKRLTVVRDAAGEEIALLDSRWVLIDTEKRVILRRHPPEVCGPWAEELGRSLPMKMASRPGDAAPVGERRAVYSLCDANGHLNNTRYVDLVLDALPPQALDGAAVETLLIFYHKEVPRGEAFMLYRAQTAPGRWYFCGVREDKCCFEAELSLRALPWRDGAAAGEAPQGGG